MISRATMNLKPAVIELDVGPASECPLWVKSGHVYCNSPCPLTPNSDRESGFPHKVMSALPPKADMCSALADVRFWPKADIKRLTVKKTAQPLHASTRGFFQQFFEFLGVELCIACGEMAAGLVAGQDQKQLAIFHPL